MSDLRLALYQPDMAPNTGAMMRLCACLGVTMDIIEPCGFPFDDRKIRRVAMDYLEQTNYVRHVSWDAFRAQQGARRLVLLTTRAETSYSDFAYKADDILMVGRESAGVPEEIHRSVTASVRVPISASTRSLNVGMAAAIVLSEALRQVQKI